CDLLKLLIEHRLKIRRSIRVQATGEHDSHARGMRNYFQLHVILFFTGGEGRFLKVVIKTDSMHFKNTLYGFSHS
ncbi:MAG: hypothetical protein NTY97_05535, partial [Planctomycetota bacterium]|nr:hypothetical protein [Planctomycetota bacterium]